MEQPQTISLKTSDFEELFQASLDWDGQYFQMAPGQFSGAIDLTQIGRRQVYRETWGRQIRYEGTAPPGTFGLALRLNQNGIAHWLGRPACPNTVVAQSPGREADLLSSETWDALVLAVPEDEVRSIATLASDPECICEDFSGVVTLKPDAADNLRRLGLDFIRGSKLARPMDGALVSRWSEQFVRLFLWEVLRAREDAGRAVSPKKPADIVKTATELVLSDQESVFGLTEICSRLGVSLRTLHYAFQDVTGVSPATWLRRIRLNRVRRTLATSSPEEVQIKRVALENGFLHFGHFGQQYKRMFGCLPSETVKATRNGATSGLRH